MNYYPIIPFVAFVVNGFMFAFVFAQARKSMINRAYLFLTMALAAWGLLDFIGWSDVPHLWRLAVLKLTPIVWGSLGFLFLWVTYAFIGRKANWIFRVALTIYLITIPISLFTDLIYVGYEETAWGMREIMGPICNFLIVTNVAIPILYSVTLLIGKYRASEGINRQMALLVGMGMISAAVLGFFFEYVVPEILQVFSFPELGSSVTVILSAFIYRGVVQHQFLSVTLEETAIEIFENAIDGIVIEEKNKPVVLANKAARQLLGIGRMPSRVRDIPELAPLGDIQDQGMREITIKRKNHRVDLHVYPAPIMRRQIPVGRLIVIRDMTEKKQDEEEKRSLEEQLLHAQKMEAVGTLAGGIAHDMNNVLAGIMGFASLVQESLDPADPIAEDIQEILVSARRGRDLTKDLLGFARKGTYKKQEVSLNNIVMEMLPILERTISKKVNLQYREGDEPCYIVCDPSQISHALMNLCINASDAMADGGDLVLMIDAVLIGEDKVKEYPSLRPGDYARLRVVDSGKGMDKKTINRVFEPFFTTKQKGQGTGLGLSMVYGTVNNHGGQVNIQSVPGKGTTVTVLLPTISKLSEPERPEITEEESVSPTSAGTVLLVDDEDVARSSAQRMLIRLGYSVVLASNGAKAVEIYRTYQDEIDLIVLDMAMPEMDGAECFWELKKLDDEVQVLIASGYARGSDTDALLKGGAIGFLPKPFEINQLAEAVHSESLPRAIRRRR